VGFLAFSFSKIKIRNNVRYMEETPCKMPIKNKIKKGINKIKKE